MDRLGSIASRIELVRLISDSTETGLIRKRIGLDWNMPVMSGIEFLEKLRMLDNGDSPRVVFCTTENDIQHIQRALEAGANEYIMKPFDSDIIETKFRQIGLL